MACLGREQIMGIFDWLEKVGRANLPCLATLNGDRGSDFPGGPTSLGRGVRFRVGYSVHGDAAMLSVGVPLRLWRRDLGAVSRYGSVALMHHLREPSDSGW